MFVTLQAVSMFGVKVFFVFLWHQPYSFMKNADHVTHPHLISPQHDSLHVNVDSDFQWEIDNLT